MTDTRARMLQELPVVYLTAFFSCALLLCRMSSGDPY